MVLLEAWFLFQRQARRSVDARIIAKDAGSCHEKGYGNMPASHDGLSRRRVADEPYPGVAENPAVQRSHGICMRWSRGQGGGGAFPLQTNCRKLHSPLSTANLALDLRARLLARRKALVDAEKQAARLRKETSTGCPGETCSVVGRDMPGTGIEAGNGKSKIPERMPAPRDKVPATPPHLGRTAATAIGTEPFCKLALAQARSFQFAHTGSPPTYCFD